ncbi:MAG: hypothetical protein R3C24_18340 [Cyanobacteriota/Melainabacteria group bacterium]
MYRLKARFSPVLMVAVLVFGASIAFLPKLDTFAGSYHFHYAVLILVELGVSLVAALILFDRGNFVQKYKIGLSMVALSCFYGTLGNIFCNFWKVNPGMDLEFSTAQLVIMNLGGVLTAMVLYKLEPIDAFSDGGLDRLKGKSTDATLEPGAIEAGAVAAAAGVTPALDSSAPSPKTSVNKLRGVTSSKQDIPAQEAPVVEERKPYTSPPQVEIDLEASDEMLSGPLNPTPQMPAASGATPEAKASPSVTGNRIQAARRRNTSTFTKLQALSASGTGSVSDPETKLTESSGDLRSLLDRLDTDEEENEKPAAAEAKPVERAPEPVTRTPEPQIQPKPVAREKAKFEAPEEIHADYLFDDLDEIDKPKAAVEVKPEPEPIAEPKAAVVEVKEEPVASPKLESLLDRVDSESEVSQDSVSTAEAAPDTAAEAESGLDDSVSGLLSKRFMELSDDDEAVAETAPEEPAAKVAEEKEEDLAEAGEKVFEAGVDSEIDDIFSTLAPEEAQREVGSTELKSEPVAEEPAEEKLFNQDVGSEIDDIFSNLAPEEAQKEVGELKKEPETKEVAEKVEEEQGIFKLQDDDVDDIFAGLTSEAQKDVDADSLAKLKEKPDNTVKTPKQTGDMPALNEEQAKRIREEASKPGKFSDTLSKIPSLKNTVEGLLHSLEEEQGMNDLDADLEVEEEEEEEEVKPTESLSPEAKAARDAAEKLKDFGRLSGKAVAKLPETADQGTMKTIGKLLIDKQAVEKIIKSGESKELGKGLSNARIISAARGKGISDLLTKIDQYDGVAGSIVVGHDGLVMASTLREGWDKDMMGALSTALLSTSNLTTKKLEIGKLRQMVMLTKDNGHAKTTVLTDVDVGILAVFLEETNVERIDGLLDTIQKTIHG